MKTARNDQIAKLYGQGEKVTYIAAVHGITANRVCQIALKYGLRRQRRTR